MTLEHLMLTAHPEVVVFHFVDLRRQMILLELGETPLQTLKREVTEELGVMPTKVYRNSEFDGLYPPSGKCLRHYVVTEWQGDVPRETLDVGNKLEWVFVGHYANELLSL